MHTRDARTYRVQQSVDTPLKVEQHESLTWRYLYARSAESVAHQQPGQDFLTFDRQGGSFVFALCDGVGQSFFGDLAARLLGGALTEWLRDQAPVDASDVGQIRTALADYLQHLTEQASVEVEALEFPKSTPLMVKEVLDDKRIGGSESTFVCVRVDLPCDDLPNGRLLAAWMGDTRLRAWAGDVELTESFPPETFRTVERWSSRSGPVLGEPHVFVGPLVTEAGHPVVSRLMAYSDGLTVLDALPAPPSDTSLTELADQTRAAAESDDISFVELCFVKDLPAPVAAASVALALPRVRRRRSRWTVDRLALVGVLGGLAAMLYFLTPLLGASPMPGSAAPAPPATPLATDTGWLVLTGSQGSIVSEAYLRYWSVLQQAFHDLDATHLSEVATGGELELHRRTVRDLSIANRGVDITVTHLLEAAAVRGDEVLLTDLNQITWRNFDSRTGQPEEIETAPFVDFPPRVTFHLVLQDGTWRVAYAQ
jgi:hypothetical protein